MITAIATVSLTAVSALLYRIGGMSKEQAGALIPWFPKELVNTKVRDIGCPLAVIGWLLICLPIMDWWAYLAAFLLMWAALTTYWDKIFKEDNFFAHGLGIALALIPIAISGSGLWLGFGLRCAALALLMGIWCLLLSNDNAEEFGRGAFIVATLPLLLV